MWPFKKAEAEPKPKEKIDVGVSIATLTLIDGREVTVTRYGRIIGSFIIYSYGILSRDLNEKWIKDDSGVFWNRNVIQSFTCETKEHWV